jgi:2-methylcitrate dehydratase PrpD
MEETRTIAKFARDTSFQAFPTGLVDEFKIFILDALAAGFVGSVQPWSRAVVEMVRRLGGSGEASLFNADWQADVSRAALANGAMIAAFECHPLTGTHASGTVLPAVLALSQRDRLSGRDFLTALIVGAEVSARLARTAVGLESERGFHNPGVLGPVAAAAAVGNLYHFDEPTLINAMGIAASTSAGLLEFAWDGANTKRIHEGRASQLGLESALLAQGGFTGPTTALEGRYGFFHAFSQPANLDRLTEGLGNEWAVRPPSHKSYPAHATTQPVIQAIQDFKREHPFELGELQRVVLTGDARMMEPRYCVRAPQSILGGQYSVPFTTAVALARDLSQPLAYNEDALNDPLIRGLAASIELITSDVPRPEVRLELNGQTHVLQTTAHKGSASNPFSWEEMSEKFSRYTGHVIDSARQSEVIDAVQNLDSLNDVMSLARLISSRG